MVTRAAARAARTQPATREEDPNRVYVRLKTYNPRRGYVLQKYTLNWEGVFYRFDGDRGWYRVPLTLAEYLYRLPARTSSLPGADGDSEGPRAFHVVGTLADAEALDRAEKRRAIQRARPKDAIVVTDLTAQGDLTTDDLRMRGDEGFDLENEDEELLEGEEKAGQPQWPDRQRRKGFANERVAQSQAPFREPLKPVQFEDPAELRRRQASEAPLGTTEVVHSNLENESLLRTKGFANEQLAQPQAPLREPRRPDVPTDEHPALADDDGLDEETDSLDDTDDVDDDGKTEVEGGETKRKAKKAKKDKR